MEYCAAIKNKERGEIFILLSEKTDYKKICISLLKTRIHTYKD